ncbi:MAG: hypothetical protein AMXMBFR47_01220 [Planctomycetota bacterium]
MAAIVGDNLDRVSSHGGLRLTAAEYFSLPDDGNVYELIDGVLVLSPSPTPRHQLVAKVILRQLDDYVERGNLGLVLYETDVQLPTPPGGRDLVYRPAILYVAADRVGQIRGRIDIVPDLIVEVVSPDSRSLDTQTKRDDYERAGVREYWLIDPEAERFTFFQRKDGAFGEVASSTTSYASEVIPGFSLDLARVRATFRSL